MDKNIARMNTCKMMFEKINISSTIVDKAFADNHYSNHHPYHNFQHLLTVSIRAMEGGSKYARPLSNIQALGIAGLFHDAGYVIGQSENVNIAHAKTMMENVALSMGIDSSIVELAKILIDSTEFPHNIVESIDEKIIQDADLMQGMEHDAQVFLNGLCVEKDDPHCADPKFPGLNGFNTMWAQEVYTKHWIH